MSGVANVFGPESLVDRFNFWKAYFFGMVQSVYTTLVAYYHAVSFKYDF